MLLSFFSWSWHYPPLWFGLITSMSFLLMTLLCSVIRSLRDWDVSPTYIFSHGHFIRYTTVTGWLNCLIFFGEFTVYTGTTLKIALKMIYCKFAVCDFRLMVCFDYSVLYVCSSFKSDHRWISKVLFKAESFWRMCQCLRITLLIFLFLGVNVVQNTRFGLGFKDFFICRYASLLFESTFVSAFTSQSSG